MPDKDRFSKYFASVFLGKIFKKFLRIVVIAVAFPNRGLLKFDGIRHKMNHQAPDFSPVMDIPEANVLSAERPHMFGRPEIRHNIKLTDKLRILIRLG